MRLMWRLASVLSVYTVCLVWADNAAVSAESDTTAAPTSVNEPERKSRVLGKLLPLRSNSSKQQSAGKTASDAAKGSASCADLDSACPEGLSVYARARKTSQTQTQARMLLMQPAARITKATGRVVNGTGAAIASVGFCRETTSANTPTATGKTITGGTDAATINLESHVHNINVSVDNLFTALTAQPPESGLVTDQLNRLRAESDLMRKQKPQMAVDVWIRLDVLLGRLEQGITFIERGVGNNDDNLIRLGMERVRTVRQGLNAFSAT